MLPLNVPFLPEEGYLSFLKGLGPRLHAVHFSLYDGALCDARVRLHHISVETLADALRRLPGPKKYLLANGRFHPGGTYAGEGSLHRLIDRLERLLDAGALDGLIFADSYLLTALGDAAPGVAARLEAVPSVNFIIDGVEKLAVLLELVSAGGFRMPGKLSLDRGLNRRPERLATLVTAIRHRWPEVMIELLANEGCLNHCPFRATHEALIAAANDGGHNSRIDTRRLNRDLACLRQLNRTPHRILASPFIRPEDLSRYEDTADLIKVCGRTLGVDFLKRTVEAYARGYYAGNLFDLLDACHWMAERWEIPNAKLPPDLFHTLTTCRQDCTDCHLCHTMFKRYARPIPLELNDLRTGDHRGK